MYNVSLNENINRSTNISQKLDPATLSGGSKPGEKESVLTVLHLLSEQGLQLGHHISESVVHVFAFHLKFRSAVVHLLREKMRHHALLQHLARHGLVVLGVIIDAVGDNHSLIGDSKGLPKDRADRC